ncbi:MAG: DUF5667 domain-containing protein [Anaerolineae bacterium]
MASKKDKVTMADLAAPRELTEAQREQALTDPLLRAALLENERQDQLLSAVPGPQVSSAVIGRILNATTMTPARKASAWKRRWVLAGAAFAAVVVISLSGTGYAAAQSLPGDTFYPIKRGYERARMGLMLNPERRAEYQLQIDAVRQAEAQRLLKLGRQGVQVDLEGVLEKDANGQWTISGVPVSLGNDMNWQPGTRVQVSGDVEGMRIRVRKMQQENLGTGTPSGDAHRYGQTLTAETAAAGTAQVAETATETAAETATPAPAVTSVSEMQTPKPGGQTAGLTGPRQEQAGSPQYGGRK